MDCDKKRAMYKDIGSWGMNIGSSVGIIITNKYLMSTTGYSFGYAMTLTWFHFLVTGLAGRVANKAGYPNQPQAVPVRALPWWEIFWFSMVANMAITAMNFSLMLNTVGLYQISKLMITPVVCIMEYLINGKQYSRQVIMSVAVVTAGVGVCTVTDFGVKTIGLFWACLAVFCSSVQQSVLKPRSEGHSGVDRIHIESSPSLCLSGENPNIHKKYSITSMELLSKIAPVQAVSLLLLGPFMDYFIGGHSLLEYIFSIGAVACILLSCSLAVICNLSQYICIDMFSATTFQVLGNMKTICVLALGWVLFGSVFSFKNLMGMTITVLGMIFYKCTEEADKRNQVMAGEVVKLLQDRVIEVIQSDLELGVKKS